MTELTAGTDGYIGALFMNNKITISTKESLRIIPIRKFEWTYDPFRLSVMQRPSSDSDFEYKWTAYIEIFERSYLKEFFDKYWSLGHLDYYSTQFEFVNSLNWHGGITYGVGRQYDRATRAMKFGCDYQHSYDTMQLYSVEGIFQELLPVFKELAKVVGGYEVEVS